MNAIKKPAASPTFNQAQVELATGFSREVLRKWEIRFGFPLPARDARDRRLYSSKDVQRLQLIKQLLHLGHRPRNLIALSGQALTRLIASCKAAVAPLEIPLATALLQTLTGSPSPSDLDALLRIRLETKGLQSFIADDLPVFNAAVGNAWANGMLGIHEEHLYTASVRRIVHERVARLQVPPDARRVVLTTPPGEQHELGILMLHAAMASHGAHCIDLGIQTPAESVVNAVQKWDVAIVCISVGVNYPNTKALTYVSTLRAMLPKGCQLWIGGQGASPLAELALVGVSIFDNIQDAIDQWAKVKGALP